MFGNRILLLVPHPDDEVVAAAAAIAQAKAKGAQIFALYLTHGCIAQNAMWAWQRKKYDAIVTRRRQEGERAAQFLGITPLGWSMRPARQVRLELTEVYAEIAAVVAIHKIDQIWTPAYEGGNADHDAANALASLFVPKISVIEFAEYNFANGKAHSHEFPAPNGSEQIIMLSPEERQRKRRALGLYPSERGNLDYVRTGRECYRHLASYDYGKPPHPGTLWYARFQWVPFRHPRIDFTTPQMVSTAITSFLATRTAINAPVAQHVRQAQARK